MTVLFADLTGSTTLGERLDPERLKEVIDSYFESMRREIEAEGGTVEKFIGDAVMAVFGAPAAHEDDPTRALRAALRMRQALARLNEVLSPIHGITLEMRIGVNTGEVVAAPGERIEKGMVMGDTVNVAARLEQSAGDGQILVAERTVHATRGFAVREVGSLTLKGKSRPLRAFELLPDQELDERQPGWERESRGHQAPMVGRRRELTLLQRLYDRVVAEGRPHLVTVYGDAGIGKTRLIEETTSTFAQEPRLVRGRCLPYGEGVTYWPLAEILKQQAGVLDTDSAGVTLSKISSAVRQLVTAGAPEDPRRATSALCFSVGIEEPEQPLRRLDPRQVRQEAHAAWRSFFEALAAEGPTVVVIEDIHWADPAMLDLLEELTDRAVGPLLFLCSARGELRAARPEWGGGRLNFSPILLDRLTSEEAEELLDLLVGDQGMPDTIRRRILARAEGNPFFLEEIIGRLADEGRGPAGRSESILDVDIPDTVQGVLAARMDLLDAPAKRALQSAAIVGRVFWAGPVQQLLDTDEDVEDLLHDLEGRGLVQSRPSSSMADEREYVFKHILTRDVAYESIPRRERAAGHARVTEWIEQQAGDREREFLELLAHHSGKAHRVAAEDPSVDTDRRDELRGKAFRYALLAAEDAGSKLSLKKAERLAQSAVSLAADPLERSRALEALGHVFFQQSLGDQAWACLREAVDLQLEIEPPDAPTISRLCAEALDVATRSRGYMRSRLSRFEADPYLEIGLRHAREGDSEERARLLALRSFWPHSFREGSSPEELAEARDAGERAAAMAVRLGRTDLASVALDGLGSYYIHQGLYGDATGVVQRRLDLGLTDAWELGDAFATASWVAFHRGRYSEALAHAEEGFEQVRDAAPAQALYCLDWRALARCRLGDWDGFTADLALARDLLGDQWDRPPGYASDHVAAAAFLHEVRGEEEDAQHVLRILDWLEEAEDRPSPGWAVWRALLLGRRGAFDEAEAQLRRPEIVSQQYCRGYLLEAHCDITATAGRWELAASIAREARDQAGRAGLEALPVYADRLEGLAALAGGEADRGGSLLARAADGFSRLGARWEAARANLGLAETMVLAGRSGEARAALGEAAAVFRSLRSLREIEKAEALQRRLA